jgi:hypothetical protein
MIRRMILTLAFVLTGGAASAQEPACTLYKVNTSLLNISQDAGGGVYIDVLEDGEIVCVTKEQKAAGGDWVFIARKQDAAKTPVNGWSAVSFLSKLSPTEAAASGGSAAASPPAVAAAPLAAVTPPPVAAAPPAAPAPSGKAAAMRTEDVLRFDQPIPFGPFPVNGKSIKQMIEEYSPLFPPIEGLPDELWKKSCTACHQWNQERLCAQGETYAKTPRYALRHQHPFGGVYKIALMRWAKSGCN